MSQEQRNTEAVRAGYAMWSDASATARAVEHWLQMFPETFEFQSLGTELDSLRLSQRRTTKAELAAYFEEFGGDWEMIRYDVRETIAQGDRVVVLARCVVRNRHTGKVLDTPKADSWRFRADGKAIEFFEFFDTAAFLEASPTHSR